MPMTYDQWKNDYPANEGPDDNSDWQSLVDAFEELLDRLNLDNIDVNSLTVGEIRRAI